VKTKSPFGENLRREREMRGVALDEIAAATRISTRFLEALEKEQWDRLPGGIFNRGFVRAVAKFLGLDEEALVSEYTMAAGDKTEMAVWSEQPPPVTRTARSARPWLMVLLLAAVAGAGWTAYLEYAPLVEAWRSPLSEAPRVQSPLPPPSPQADGAGATGATPEPAKLELQVSVGAATRVTVVADGKTVLNRTMSANESQRFEATDRFEVAAENSSAVLLEMNGQAMPALGTPGEPGRLVLTRSDLKKQVGGQD